MEAVPTDLELCFEEFLESNRPPSDWHTFLRTQNIILDQRTNAYRVLAPGVDTDDTPYTYVLPPSMDPQSREALLLKETRDRVEVPYLSSGGFVNVLTLEPSLEGHYDVTSAVLASDFSFYAESIELVSSASRDPDFFSWYKDEAHAQTPTITGQAIVGSENVHTGAAATAKFLAYLSSEVATIKARCAANDRLAALYHIGIGLHAVQDLAAHRGRTAAEHSWNANCRNRACDGGAVDAKDGDPDEDPGNIELAKSFSRRWLNRLRSILGETCWERLKTYQGTQGSWIDYLARLVMARDLTLSAYREYKALGPRYAGLPDKAPHTVRWFNTMSEARPLFDRIESAMAEAPNP